MTKRMVFTSTASIQVNRIHGPCSYWPGENPRTAEIDSFVVAPPFRIEPELQPRVFELLKMGINTPFHKVAHPICPSCPNENFCRPCRIDLSRFELTKSQQKKIKKFNKKFYFDPKRLEPAEFYNAYKLYKNYMCIRHEKDEDYMCYNFFALTYLSVGHHAYLIRDKEKHEIVGCMIWDCFEKSVRLKRHFYDTNLEKDSIGICLILGTLQRLKQSCPDGIVYLGSWSPGSPKLDYKKQFKGFEVYDSAGKWVPYDYRNSSTPIPEPCRKPVKERISFENPSPSAGIRVA